MAEQGFVSDLYRILFGQQGGFEQGPSNFDPQQQQAISSSLQQGLQGLGTDKIEGAARRGFQQSTIPLLSERFANIGQRGLSGIGSSGYQNELQDEGTLLETQLAKLRQENANNLLNVGLTPTGNNYFRPGQEGIGGDLIKILTDAGLTYATGGLNKGGTIMDLFKSILGGGKGGQESSDNIGISSEASTPFQRLLGQQSGNQLLNQRVQSQLGLPGAGQMPSSIASHNMLRKGGFNNIQNLMKQATASSLGGSLQQPVGQRIIW